MGTAITADDLEQYELITDDPRVDAEELGPLQVIRAYREAKKLHGDLISRPLACEILGVSGGQLAVWCIRGRLTDVAIGPVKLVPSDEVIALWKERHQGGFAVGGRGHKLPSMADVVRLGLQVGK